MLDHPFDAERLAGHVTKLSRGIRGSHEGWTKDDSQIPGAHQVLPAVGFHSAEQKDMRSVVVTDDLSIYYNASHLLRCNINSFSVLKWAFGSCWIRASN